MQLGPSVTLEIRLPIHVNCSKGENLTTSCFACIECVNSQVDLKANGQPLRRRFMGEPPLRLLFAARRHDAWMFPTRPH
jgi:hypothetical protein